ncbi:MAG: DUF2795 domain-containing protein [Candidatus Paracaedibacteraceae bacterium]|nr:DUF2795 domain-containing protein [Candidatus Paracaedibacteraceae bacterium]
MENQFNPLQVEKYLKGISFPASKDDLIKQKENNKAHEQVLIILRKFSEGKYGSATEGAKEAKKYK